MHRGGLRVRHQTAREARRMHCGIHGKNDENETISKERFYCAFQRKICNATGDSDGRRTMRALTTLTMHGLSEHVRWGNTAPARNARIVCLTTCCDHLALRDCARRPEQAHAVILNDQQATAS